MRFLSLGKQFRPATSQVYPPFKHGRYMEEYVYDYFTRVEIKTDYVYIPIFWTNLQNHPAFSQIKARYQLLLNNAIESEERLAGQKLAYVTIVQHDDGPGLALPPNTLIFGACTGTVPLPLIYEDTRDTLLNEPRAEKVYLASFIGSITHPIRSVLCEVIKPYQDIVCNQKNIWSSHVSDQLAAQFSTITVRSKFCLCPRGYGRSSFRFFESMLLDTIPVYLWDDVCWLPYQDILDYSTFSVCIHYNDIHRIHDILSAITEEQYVSMIQKMHEVRYMFTLEWMCGYISRQLHSLINFSE